MRRLFGNKNVYRRWRSFNSGLIFISFFFPWMIMGCSATTPDTGWEIVLNFINDIPSLTEAGGDLLNLLGWWSPFALLIYVGYSVILVIKKSSQKHSYMPIIFLLLPFSIIFIFSLVMGAYFGIYVALAGVISSLILEIELVNNNRKRRGIDEAERGGG